MNAIDDEFRIGAKILSDRRRKKCNKFSNNFRNKFIELGNYDLAKSFANRKEQLVMNKLARICLAFQEYEIQLRYSKMIARQRFREHINKKYGVFAGTSNLDRYGSKNSGGVNMREIKLRLHEKTGKTKILGGNNIDVVTLMDMATDFYKFANEKRKKVLPIKKS